MLHQLEGLFGFLIPTSFHNETQFPHPSPNILNKPFLSQIPCPVSHLITFCRRCNTQSFILLLFPILQQCKGSDIFLSKQHESSRVSHYFKNLWLELAEFIGQWIDSCLYSIYMNGIPLLTYSNTNFSCHFRRIFPILYFLLILSWNSLHCSLLHNEDLFQFSTYDIPPLIPPLLFITLFSSALSGSNLL